jgi:ATP-dependent RNA helicase DeaD
MLRESSGREGSSIEEDREPERPARREGGNRFQREERERPQRGDFQRDERGPKPKFERGPIPNEQGMTRLFISLGKMQGILPKDIVGMMYREAGLPDGSLGRITLFPKHTLVDVPDDFADQAIRSTRNSKLRGKTFRIDVDRGPTM